MKLIIAMILSLQISAFAAEPAKTEKAEKRKVAQQEGVCAHQAGEVARGIAKALKQDTTVEMVALLQSQKNLEIYNVKLKGKGFTSEMTQKYWMIQLWDTGDGCNYKSATLEDAAG